MKGKRKVLVMSKLTEHRSRQEARKLIKSLSLKVDWYTHCVHHIDGNPFNNELDNLMIVTPHEHSLIHNGKLKQYWPKY